MIVRNPLALLTLLFVLAAELTSCASSSVTPTGRTKISATKEFDQHSGMPVVRLPNNRIATGTFDADSIRFECYSSADMTDIWHKAIGLERDEKWDPVFHVNGERMVAIGRASWADGDTVGLRAMIVDPSSGNIAKETVLFREPKPEARSKRGGYHVLRSPDSTKFFVYQCKYEDAVEKEHNRFVLVNGYVYSLDLTQVSFGSLQIPIPDDVDDDDLDDDKYSNAIWLDNNGNFYKAGIIAPNTISVYQYNTKLHTASHLDSTFDHIDIKDNEYAIRSPRATFDVPGRMTLGFTRMKDKSEVDAFVLAIFNFNSGKVERTVAHMPSPAQWEAWFDDDEAESYDITHLFYTDEPKMLVAIAEKDKSHMETYNTYDSKGRSTGSYSQYIYDKGETVVMGFDTTLQFKFNSALKKDQATALGPDVSFITRVLQNKVELFYMDRDEGGLFRCDVALPSGTLSQPLEIAEVGKAASFMRSLTLWDQENLAYLYFRQGMWNPTVTLYRVEM